MKSVSVSLFRPTLVTLCVLALCILAGCSTISEGWDSTTGYYQEYVKPTAEVEYDDPTPADDEEVRMARLFMPVDARVQELRTFLDGQDAMPRREWVTMLFERYGWISGLVTADKSGRIIGRQPEVSTKPLPLSALMAMEEGWVEPKVRAYLQKTSFGPEIYLSYPIMEDEEWLGLNIVHFSPEDVAAFSPDPDRLVFFSRDVMLWPGAAPQAADALQSLDWEAKLAEDISGTVEVEQGEYYWFVRYLSGEYIIYAVPAPVED